MKEQIVSHLRALSPTLADKLTRVWGRMPAERRQLGAIQELRDQVELLRTEVRELRTEIDECRRDALRIAELTDIVEQRLASPKDS